MIYHLYGLNPLILLRDYHKEDTQSDFFYDISLKLVECLQKYDMNYQICKAFAPVLHDIEKNQIHYGIVPQFKKHEEYKRLFFDYVDGFYGLSVNIFQDSNNDKIKKQNKLIMVSMGSWNHNYRKYLPTKPGIHYEMLALLHRDVSEYQMNKESTKIVLFVQNYSPTEYWFGWSKEDDGDGDDINIWVKRELSVIGKIRDLCGDNYDIMVKFHPKTAVLFKEYMKKHILHNFAFNLCFIEENTSLDALLIENKVYCCVVNSGTVVVEACLRGIPSFYMDDYYSNIPVHRFCLPIEKIKSFTLADLPSQRSFLDFICSQCFVVDENLDDLICLLK